MKNINSANPESAVELQKRNGGMGGPYKACSTHLTGFSIGLAFLADIHNSHESVKRSCAPSGVRPLEAMGPRARAPTKDAQEGMTR